MTLPHDEAGAGPAVLLLHAGIADRTMWSATLPLVAGAGHRAIAVDLPGFGEAPVAPGEQAAWLDVVAALDDLGIERAILVGASFGGAVAQRVAVVSPERVAALALVCAPDPVLEPSPETEAVWEAEEAALERGDTDAAVAAVVAGWTLADAPPELRDRVAAMQRRAFARRAAAPEAWEAPDPLEADPDLLRTVDVAALVVAGGRDKPDFVAGAEALARRLPHARLEVLAEAGHLPALETPDAFHALLLAWLRELG